MKSQLGQFLMYLAESLDISDTRYVEAEDRYKAVGQWLGKEGSILAQYNPQIYPQGSFRLGTVIRPFDDREEYDIDLVCELQESKEVITQQQLKKMVGDRLKANGDYDRMLDKEEGRRCWTLNYSNGAQFHMDILPAIPEDEGVKQLLFANGVPPVLAEKAISITDIKSNSYNSLDHDWPRSNPKGYADWFHERMKVRFDSLRKSMAESLRAATIEAVPEFRVKTPLQRAIQILKRHRDMMFINDCDDKPVSIIISTLAAHAYKNEADIVDCILSLLDEMPLFIESRGGVSWVPNPVNPMENFADKWHEHPQRELKFRKWLRQVADDLRSALQEGNVGKLQEVFRARFGTRAVNEALAKSEKVMVGAAIADSKTPPRIEIHTPNKPWKA
ncbi:MAG: hypothetical protein A2Y12_19205 [Planctomycetes bacterium GWF2_42_9]|nr:MAG: hypothetical protein A2Y12_19205 [Planctomycetes bacterium GWF2_42_9]